MLNVQRPSDAIQLPTLKAANNVTNGTIILNGFDSGQGSTTNFYIGIRNINIDTTAAKPNISKCKKR
jgi:glucan 1,3-beta-glucosidase